MMHGLTKIKSNLKFFSYLGTDLSSKLKTVYKHFNAHHTTVRFTLNTVDFAKRMNLWVL